MSYEGGFIREGEGTCREKAVFSREKAVFSISSSFSLSETH